MFNNDSESKQLVDLITTFGQAFPLLDENGEEIVPPDTGTSYFYILYCSFTFIIKRDNYSDV